MKKEVYVCDLCGVEKKEANHWWKAYKIDSYITVLPWTDSAEILSRVHQPILHLCGENCVVKAVTAFMAVLTEQLKRKS